MSSLWSVPFSFLSTNLFFISLLQRQMKEGKIENLSVLIKENNLTSAAPLERFLHLICAQESKLIKFRKLTFKVFSSAAIYFLSTVSEGKVEHLNENLSLWTEAVYLCLTESPLRTPKIETVNWLLLTFHWLWRDLASSLNSSEAVH